MRKILYLLSRYDIENPNYNLAGRLLTWMSKLRNENNHDYYWNFEDFRKPRIFSSMTNEEYRPLSDIDESDFKSFKRGYTLIQRVLIRIRRYPSVQPSTPNVDDKIAFMLKVCLEKMSSVLLFIIRSTEHMTLDENSVMNLMDEVHMDSEIAASTPKKSENSGTKRKSDFDCNETQGPEMNNPNYDTYKPGPNGDNATDRQSSSDEQCSPAKKRKITHKKPVRRKLKFKNP